MVSQAQELTILCLASYEKGAEFMRECRRQGCRVLLLTRETLAQANWPREVLDDIFYLPVGAGRDDLIKGVSYLARTHAIDRIVPLDDYDVEMAALLREHLRIPGMGDTTVRYFRDKLAMRVKARDRGILVPEFIHVLNHYAVGKFMERVPTPWVLKPRSEAAAIGIKKIDRAEELWSALEELGDRQSFYVLERYIPGDIYHVDAIVSEREVVFAVAHKYGHPPMDVAHHGGVFMTRRLPRDSWEAQTVESLNQKLISALGLVRGVTHTEFIRGRGGSDFYFLETAARVGGAHIVEVVEAASGINLWAEWAKIEIAGGERPYHLPEHRDDYAGIVISLARQEFPDTSAYCDPEIVWRLNKRHHVGLIVASKNAERVDALLRSYSQRFLEDFFATEPLPNQPTD